MKVILLTDVKKVGQRGTVQEVADGYAQNVLIPKKQAVPATAELLKVHTKKEEIRAKERAEEDEKVIASLKTVSQKEVRLSVRANDTGGLFKSITPEEVVRAIQSECHVTIPQSFVTMDTIKQTGTFPVSLSYQKVKISFSLIVEPQ